MKLKESELKALQAATQVQDEMLRKYGAMAYDLAHFKEQMDELKKMLNDSRKAYDDMLVEIQNEYGVVTIDLGTGALTPVTDESK